MKKLVLFSLVLFLVGCSPPLEQTSGVEAMDSMDKDNEVAVILEDLGAAPEWQNETWLTSDQPLYLQDLRGKVVLLDMWTFG